MRERGAESAAPPPSGVALDQHAASLTALASLLGYLEFSPSIAVSSAPAADADAADADAADAQRPGAGLGSGGRHVPPPPVDVLRALEEARIHGTVTITLPWVLALLRFACMDTNVLRAPYYLAALRRCVPIRALVCDVHSSCCTRCTLMCIWALEGRRDD